MKKTATFFLLLCSFASYAQNKKFHYTEFISFQRAHLAYVASVNVPRKFHTLELKLGVCLIKPISKHLELRSRIGYGIKFRRMYDDRILQMRPGKEATILQSIYSEANECLAKQNTDFVDIPIILHYKTDNKLGIEVGFNYRTYGWFYDVPFIPLDYGLLLNLTYAFRQLSIVVGYTIGRHDFLGGRYNYSPGRGPSVNFSWTATNNAVQLGIEYDLFKKLKKTRKE